MIIALIDKHPVSLKGLSLFLKESIKKVTIIAADNVNEYDKTYSKKKPDLVILSIYQNWNRDNLHIIKLLRKRLPNVPFIVYDSDPDISMIPQYLKAGINGYLFKQSSLSELQECIKTVGEHRHYISNKVLESITSENQGKGKNQKTNNIFTLSAREFETARYLVQGIKVSLIADTLGRNISTISNIKASIYKKLGIDNVLKLRDLIQQNKIQR